MLEETLWLACVSNKTNPQSETSARRVGERRWGTPAWNPTVCGVTQSRADKIPSSRVSNLGFEDCLADCSGATKPILPQIY